MAITPARITPDVPEADVQGLGDTERPKALSESDDASNLSEGGGLVEDQVFSFGTPPAMKAIAVAEATRVGPPPDPAMIAAARALPTNEGHPQSLPNQVVASDRSSRSLEAASPSHSRATVSERRIPIGPPASSRNLPTRSLQLTPVSDDGQSERTSLGLGPPSSPVLASASSSQPFASPSSSKRFAPPATTSQHLVASPQSARGLSVSSIVIGSDRASARRCSSCEQLYPADFLVCPRDATPLVSVEDVDSDPLVGGLIGETYQIVRVVGEGGMGRVYEARHLRLKERRFAVKCLHADLARNPEMAARFLREAESASSIKHENVVDVFDVHHLPDGTPYLVGEFLEGEELAGYVEKRGPLDARVAAKIARQVCNALTAAHARGIVHRDMKPENIFVLGKSIAAVERGESRTLQIKVLDFGISKAGPGDNSHLTRTGVIMGTPSYMAPEQARGRPVDHRADIYSVGACLYFMVTGRRPFDADDPTATLSMVLTEDPVRPRELDQRIPEMLELIIQRAMAKDASERYATMTEFERTLAMFMGRSSLAIPSEGAMVPVSLSDPLHGSGASRAFDVAKAMLVGGSSAPPLAQSNNLARVARPTIVVTSLALGTWLVGGTIAALAGLVRVLHEGEITLTESLLLVVGCLFAGATPIGLYIVHLRKIVWPNSVRALQLATDLKRTAVSAFVTYGCVAIVGRIVHTVFWRNSVGLASGIWDISLFAISVFVALTIGGFGPLLRNLRRRRRRRG